MKLCGWHLVVLVAIASAAAGCGTGSDVLNSGNSTLRFELAIVGETETTIAWECALFDFGDVRARPLDGFCDDASPEPGEACLSSEDCAPGLCLSAAAGEVIPSEGIAVAFAAETTRGNLLGSGCSSVHGPPPSAIDLNSLVFTDTEIELPAPIVVTEGLYEVNRLNVTEMTLFRDDPDVFETRLRRCLGSLEVAQALDGLLRFTVSPDEDKVVRIVIDVAAWEELTDAGPPITTNNCFDLGGILDGIVSCEGCNPPAAP